MIFLSLALEVGMTDDGCHSEGSDEGTTRNLISDDRCYAKFVTSLYRYTFHY